MIIAIANLLLSKMTLFTADIIGNHCKGADVLGLRSWYYYLPANDFQGCSFKNFHFLPPPASNPNGPPSDIPLILLAVVDDLLRIAGVVAVAFVLIGAFKYVAGQGDPEQTARAQSTIINALLGTAIAITAAVFVDFLGQKLGG